MTIQWNTKAFDQLTGREVHDLLKLRVDVFVVEQRCAYHEVDGKDPHALHILGHEPSGRLVAYARILPAEDGGWARIGRVIISEEYRAKGIAHQLMEQALASLHTRFGTRRSMLSAQSHLEHFYGAHGYTRVGPDYDWDGIAHVDMQRTAD